ncbi:GntR family transcriptional regulator [Pseudonocardia sp. GCM10023141]|uniref:GntR family transcriptional regulator n=1 Tax=Pseudonocardia sp. GCM10023141 TaxID=3252653 RepID=UPI00361AA738
MPPSASPLPTAGRITRPLSLRESAYDAILAMIVNRSLEPGRHLVENELAATLGVSRQPVREALQALSNDGWVDLRPGHGAFVHDPSDDEADQLLAVRGLLEAESARLAALNAAADGVAQLRAVCERGTAAWKAQDMPAVVAANTALHAQVMRLSGNTVLQELAAQVDRRVQWYYTPVARHRGGQSWKEHAELIDAIAAGDADGAASVMRSHTEQTRRCYSERKAEGRLETDVFHSGTAGG